MAVDQLQLIPNYTTSWIGNTFAGGPQWIQDFIDDMTVENRGNGWRCYCNSGWDEAHSECSEIWFDSTGWHMLPHKKNEFPEVSSKSVVVLNKTFTINTDGSTSMVNGPLVNVQNATALGIYRPKNYLMVADSGDHTIKFFDVSTTNPFLVKTFGTPGGLLSSSGKTIPTVFWGLTGCGSDNLGNLYISMSELGAVIRRFAVVDPLGLVWDESNVAEVIGTHFGDVCDFDPKTDGLVIYGKNERYEMDYSKPTGQQWKIVANTYLKQQNLNDPRNKDQNSIKVRYKDGVKFLFSYDQNDGGINVYKFNGEFTQQFLFITGKTGIKTSYVDNNCDIWETSIGNIFITKCTGVVAGNLQYATPAIFCPVPAPFTQAMRVLYDSARDIMYIAGGTAQLKAWGYGHPGPVVAKYINWSISITRSLTWTINLPYLHDDIQPALSRIVPEAWDFAGDRLYIAYLFYDVKPNLPFPYNDSPGPVRVYDGKDGKFLGRLIAGPEVYHHSGSVDLFNGISAFERQDGTHLILVEEVWKNKNLLYIYKPDVVVPPPPPPPPPPVGPKVVNAVSRRKHGTKGNFDIPLSIDESEVISLIPIECRGGVKQSIVINFDKPIVSAAIVLEPSLNKKANLANWVQNNEKSITINLDNVSDAQLLKIKLNDITGIDGAKNNGVLRMRILIGDIDGDGVVSKNDEEILIRYFRMDINNSGDITEQDLLSVKNRIGLKI
jgi:hypothetical protein